MLTFSEKILVFSSRCPTLPLTLQAGQFTYSVEGRHHQEVLAIEQALLANELMPDPIDTFIRAVIE